MSQICISPPTILAVTLEQAKLNLRVDGDYLDGLIEIWLQGIIAELEHEIGQCLMVQTWRVALPAFAGAIRLPHPAIAITSVKYIDAAGTEQTMASSAYQVEVQAYKSLLRPALGTCWPSAYVDAFADVGDLPPMVFIELTCGLGNTSDLTPANIQLYILAKLVEQFDPVTRTERDTVQSTYIERLLDACRTHS